MDKNLTSNNDDHPPTSRSKLEEKSSKSTEYQQQTPSDRYSQFSNLTSEYQDKSIGVYTFHLETRYEIIKHLGWNSYGGTVKAKDLLATDDKQSFILIHKMQGAFDEEEDAKALLRELKIQRLLLHENICRINKLLLPKSRKEFNDVYICTPFIETDLYRVIHSRVPVTDEHIQYFFYQILRGVLYMHSAGVVHGDLSPANILVTTNCDVFITGFHKARVIQSHGTKFNYPKWVLARYYSESFPLLEEHGASTARDIWSVGYMLALCFTRSIFFLPNNHSPDHLEAVIRTFGAPSSEYISKLQNPNSREQIEKYAAMECIALEDRLPKDTNLLAIDLIKKLMMVDPSERLTAEEALCHPYFRDLHDPHDEPITSLIPKAEFEFDNYQLTTEQLKDLVYEEILLYHFEEFKKDYVRKVEEGKNPFDGVIDSDTPKVADAGDWIR